MNHNLVSNVTYIIYIILGSHTVADAASGANKSFCTCVLEQLFYSTNTVIISVTSTLI